MQNKSNQVTKHKFLWFNNHTTILSSSGYRHYRFKVKSDCFPHMKTWCENNHIAHCSAKLLTTHRRQSCQGGKGGAGWSEVKRETLHMQNRSGGGGALCWVTVVGIILLYKPHEAEDLGTRRGFLGGPVIKNPPYKTGDTGSVPGRGRSHIPQNN